jgi:hypothetical protein
MYHPRRKKWGSGYIDPKGYRRFGNNLEHRIVMEKKLGRKLRLNERVHHINGKRTDNRPSNLELMAMNTQFSGQRVKDLVAHAREIIKRYAKEI